MPGKLISKTWQHDPTADAPAKYRRACKYAAFVPEPLSSLTFGLEGAVAGVVSEAEHAIRTLNTEGGPALGPLARLLLRTESIASSKVEGLQLGVRELARAEAKIESGIAAGVTAKEVIANIDAMVLAVEAPPRAERGDAAEAKPFRTKEIVAIHRRLMPNAPRPAIAGRIRSGQNWIGGNDFNPCGADFVPPPPDDVDRLLADLCAAVNDDTLPPLVQAALVHAQFETIHPFDDGNGRTGRALIHVVLRRRGLTPHFVPPISVVFARAKDRYIDGLTGFRGDAVTLWIEQFAGATLRAARLAEDYVRAVRALQEEWRERLRAGGRAPRADAAVWGIIDLMPAHPMISAPVAAAVTGRAKSRVYEAIDSLVDAGILIPLSSGNRNRWWEADGLLDVIGRLEDGEPVVAGKNSDRRTGAEI